MTVISTLAEAQDSLGAVSAQGVQLEAISLDARPQVVLHFDFMSKSATQVLSAVVEHPVSGELQCAMVISPALQAATAATLLASFLGVAILIAEMVIKFTQVYNLVNSAWNQMCVGLRWL